MAPRSDASVLTRFNDNGWSSAGLACLVGISAPVVSTIGAVSGSGFIVLPIRPSGEMNTNRVLLPGLAMPLIRGTEKCEQNSAYEHVGHSTHELHPGLHHARYPRILCR